MPLPITERVALIKKQFPTFWAKNKYCYDFIPERQSSGRHLYFYYLHNFCSDFVYRENFKYETVLNNIENQIKKDQSALEQIDLKKHPTIVQRLQNAHNANIQQATEAKDLITSLLNQTLLSHVHRY